MKIYNIGFYPPPLGGVSNHMKRLHEFLLAHKEDSVLLDITGVAKTARGVCCCSMRSVLKHVFASESSIFHFHVDSLRSIILMFLIKFRHRVIFSWHNERIMKILDSQPVFRKKIYLSILRKLDCIITDNQDCFEYATRKFGLENVQTIAEYIPSHGTSVADEERLAPYRGKFTLLLSSNAFQISFHNDQDTYGIDLLIEMVSRLGRKDVGFIFLLPGGGHEDYYERLNNRIKDLGIDEQFIFIRTPLEEASSLWKNSDVVIRATNTDGNSLSIHEALVSGTPVIASDCVPRPQGVVLFKTRDLEDLVRVVREMIEHLDDQKEKVRSYRPENNAEKILAVYHRMMEDRH